MKNHFYFGEEAIIDYRNVKAVHTLPQQANSTVKTIAIKMKGHEIRLNNREADAFCNRFHKYILSRVREGRMILFYRISIIILMGVILYLQMS